MPATPSFDSFGLSEAVLKGIADAGFTAPSPVQAAAIPHVLAGKDLLALAPTGTGKTAAFGLPALSRLDPAKKGVQMLVIVPTRELAAQVADEVHRLGKHCGARTVAITGGESSWRQIESARSAHVAVGTPGRLKDLLESGRLPRFAPGTVVLDEADEMLDMGFLEDIEAIFKQLPTPRQTLLFSATMPEPIARLAQRVMVEPVRLDLAGGGRPAAAVESRYVVIDERERCEAVARLLEGGVEGKTIVFCRTKIETHELATVLSARGLPARALHGDIEQAERTRVLRNFRQGGTDVLVATDVAARGLDIGGVTHVINYHLPFDQEAYIHRVGRTGRAGKSGVATTLVTAYELHRLRRIQWALRAQFTPTEVPSLSELNRKHDEKLAEEIKAQPIHDDAVDLLARLTADLDPAEVAARLLSMLLAKRPPATGPERVGLRADQAKKLDERRPQGGGSGGGYRGRPQAGRGPYRREGGQGGGPYRREGGGGNGPYRGPRRDDGGDGGGEGRGGGFRRGPR